MAEKKMKRSYYLPPQLIAQWAKWCQPGRNFSPKVAAAMLAIMALDDRNLLESLAQLAHQKDIAASISTARNLLTDVVLNREIASELEAFGPQRAQILIALRQAITQSSPASSGNPEHS